MMFRFLTLILVLIFHPNIFSQEIPSESKIYEWDSEGTLKENIDVKLEKTESLSPFGIVQQHKQNELFAVKKLFSENKTTIISQRKIESMEAGVSYRATFGIYRNGKKTNEVSDLVHVSHILEPTSDKKTTDDHSTEAPIIHELFSVSFDPSEEHKHGALEHQFLLYVPEGTTLNSIDFLAKESRDTITIKVIDEEDHVIEQKSTVDKKQKLAVSVAGPSMVLLNISFGHSETAYSLNVSGLVNDGEEDQELETGKILGMACRKASRSQRRSVNRGNAKKANFMRRCAQQTSNSDWCEQVIRPNPSSRATFSCTYGSNQVHQLIHPSTSTWKHAIESVKIIKELQDSGIKVCRISNWWRPEPYNKNVGGSPTRHPYGTAVDVLFCSKDDQNKAFSKLCKMRRAGRVRAIGYYGNPTLHFGIGDRRGNTWGKSCP